MSLTNVLSTIVLLAGTATTGPEPGLPASGDTATLHIGQVLEDADGDRVPDRLGETVTTRGVVITRPAPFGDEGAVVNLQDATGGVALFSVDAPALLGLSEGDSVEVKGTVGQYRGGEYLMAAGITRLGEGTVPAPQDVLASEAASERLAGRLVRLAGELRVTRDEASWAQAELRDRSGTLPVVFNPKWLTDSGFVERVERGGPVEIVGVVAQSTDSVPPDDGYYLFPRSADALAFSPAPPWGALGTAALLLVILGLVAWRRAAVRRARELEELSGELERSRDKLREREAWLRSLVENAADTVSVVDEDGTIVYQSPSVERMLGWGPDELTGRSIVDFVHPDDCELLAAFREALAEEEGATREIEVRLRAKDGRWRHLEILGTSRAHDPAVRGIVCNARDVTEHRKLQEQVRQADRMEVVGRLAGGIAHDFNNVLTALRGHAEMALVELPEHVGGRRDVQEVVRAADRAASLTGQLLAFSRQQVLKPRVVSPTGIVRDMLPMIRRLIGEDVEVRHSLPEGTAAIRVDTAQFEQVLMNLVVNARDAMPDGGCLTVELADDRGPGAGSPPETVPTEPGAWVRLTVADDGAGIPDDVIGHIFEPFFTTKEQGKGTGLGLATLYGIVRQSGGHVRVRSQVDRGTRFDVYFPATEDVPDEIDEAPEHQEPGRGGEVILLVEDEGPVRRLARRVLEREEYRILEADAPSAALELAAAHGGPIDLLLTDVVMPEMSGPALATTLRDTGRDFATIFTSGYTRDEVVRDGVAAGDALFLEKPFGPAELLRAVRSALERRPKAGEKREALAVR